MFQEKSQWGKWILSGWGVSTILYCLLVLGYVATSPDLGLRCLMIDPVRPPEGEGPIISLVSDIIQAHGPAPQAGDRLLKIGREPVPSFLHFTRQLSSLRTPQVPPGGVLHTQTDLTDQSQLLPPVVEIDGIRWVEVEYRTAAERLSRTCWLQVQSLPKGPMALSFIWFLLECGIFAVGALAFWSRPFDHPSRLFFAMCTVSLGGFVGGYHWWVIGGNVWLTVPFAVSAVFVPVVTLHFFLIYPQPKLLMQQARRTMLVALYGLPAVVTVGMVGLIVYASILQQRGADGAVIREVLGWLDATIYYYLVAAAGYFLTTLVVLLISFFTAHTPVVQNQVKWIFIASLVATLPVSYTLYLAAFHKVEFALGQASPPMFLASLLFMLAYAVAIVRYKLMLIDDILNRGMLYYLFSFLATFLYSLAIASTCVVGLQQRWPWSRQTFSVLATVMVSVLLMGWFRDRLQGVIDRRFFREKYQFDKALQRMNDAVGHLVEPEILADRMLTSCREVLGNQRAALYLRDPQRGDLRLIATDGSAQVPLQFPSHEELWDVLHDDVTGQQRLNPDIHEPMSPTQRLLRELDVDLVHGLEVDGVLAGVLLLGAKRNGTPYSAEDLAFLNALGQITSVALHSVNVHRMVSRLNDELRLNLDKIAEQQRFIAMLQAEVTSRQDTLPAPEPDAFRHDHIKGRGTAIRQVLETVRKVSNSQASVLIRGESGTGKELLARVLHENSPRRNGPLVSVHCGALSAGLLESELFGHVKGSFTGAHKDRVGRFEMAHGGTLFLDEIGDISWETQIKLLRVLQERSFEPVGGSRTIQVDVRLIAATHQNLEKLIREGKFREDLFYRLNVVSITLPPLREREDDIFELALHFLSRAAARVGKTLTHFDEAAIAALQRYDWPGNIRELENVVERAVVLADGPCITCHDLPPQVAAAATRDLSAGSRPLADGPSSLSLATASFIAEQRLLLPNDVTQLSVPVRTPAANGGSRKRRSPSRTIYSDPAHPLTSGFVATSTPAAASRGPNGGTSSDLSSERDQLLAALTRSQGNKAEAARLLGLPRSTLFSKLRKHGIEC